MTAPDPLSAAPVDIAGAYAWPDGRWTRAMMLTTLNGAIAGADGRSGSLSSDTDRLIFAETRRLADAVLVGAGTIRAERYNPMRAKPEQQTARAADGLQPAPVVVIVSHSLDLPWQDGLFHESVQQPIVLTDAHDPASPALRQARENADVIEVADLDAAGMIGALHARGLNRIVCEGGPALLTSLVAADLIDEYDVTVAPILSGQGYGIIDGPLAATRRLRLAQATAADGFIFAKYLR
jgi:riboflavin biosynthesis pyrimidine reductase